MRCTEVADPSFPDGKFFGRDIGDRCRSALNKMMVALRLICIAVVFAIAGCDSVTIDRVIGERVHLEKLNTVIGKWTVSGKWDNEENKIVEMQVTKTGELVSAYIAWDESSQRFDLKSSVLNVRRLGDAIYLFVTDKDKTGFFRFEIEGNNEIQLFFPDPIKFRDAVISGTLTGDIVSSPGEKMEVKIKADEKTTAILTSREWRDYVDKPFLLLKRLEIQK